MTSATQISMVEYLETDFRPDRECVEGEVRERDAGTRVSRLDGSLG